MKRYKEYGGIYEFRQDKYGEWVKYEEVKEEIDNKVEIALLEGEVDHEEIRQLGKVLEFYADINNWHSSSKGYAMADESMRNKIHKDRGKRARQALKRINEYLPDKI